MVTDTLYKQYNSLANIPSMSLIIKITYHFTTIAVTMLLSFMYEQFSQKSTQFFKAFYTDCCLMPMVIKCKFNSSIKLTKFKSYQGHKKCTEMCRNNSNS